MLAILKSVFTKEIESHNEPGSGQNIFLVISWISFLIKEAAAQEHELQFVLLVFVGNQRSGRLVWPAAPLQGIWEKLMSSALRNGLTVANTPKSGLKHKFYWEHCSFGGWTHFWPLDGPQHGVMAFVSRPILTPRRKTEELRCSSQARIDAAKWEVLRKNGRKCQFALFQYILLIGL